MASAVGFNIIGSEWSNQGTSVSKDTMALLFALMLHAPLLFMKVDAHKKADESKSERLVSVDLIETLKKEEPAPLPPLKAEKSSLKEKMMKLVRRAPPPPPPPVEKKPEVAEKIADVPSKIALQPKLDMADKIAPKLQGKEGFKTKADPKLVEDKKIAMNAGTAGIAPLSAKRLGVIEDRAKLKSDKGNFAAKSRDVSSIGGDSGPALAGVAAPAIAINTGGKGSVEKFSAAPIQKSDKGRIGGVSVDGVGGGPQLGLRDSIIARDAAPTQIAMGGRAGGVAGGVAGGIPGGTGTKRDAGRFDGSEGGSVGGVVGGRGSVVGGTGRSTIATGAAPIASKPRGQKSMFTITGPLKDRRIERQIAPEYPAWAQSQGIEASVTVEFTVDPMGMVKPNIVVRRTSGYPKLDETAIKALRQWKFVPLAGGENRDEVGLITFNYTLS